MTPRQKLAAPQIQRRLRDLLGWELRDGKLHRELRFSTFVEAFGFMAQVALLAERRNHHPSWSNVYNTVTIDLDTHDVGGISDADFELAEAINQLLGPG